MKDTRLSHRDAAWLAQTIHKRREQFAGWRMEADPASSPGGDPAPGAAPGQAEKNEPLGEGGKKALDAERDARKAAEQELTKLRGEFDSFKSALTEAVGIKPEKGKEDDTLTQVQRQLSQMQLENDVLRLATQHRITDSDDLDLLRSATDAQAREKLAGRLAARADAETPGTPKPDSTQGGKGDPAPADPGPGLPRLMAAYANSSSTTKS